MQEGNVVTELYIRTMEHSSAHNTARYWKQKLHS